MKKAIGWTAHYDSCVSNLEKELLQMSGNKFQYTYNMISEIINTLHKCLWINLFNDLWLNLQDWNLWENCTIIKIQLHFTILILDPIKKVLFQILHLFKDLLRITVPIFSTNDLLNIKKKLIIICLKASGRMSCWEKIESVPFPITKYLDCWKMIWTLCI